MTKKEKKPVPPVTEEPKNEAPAEAPSAPVVPEAAAPIQIPPKVLEQAKALGIDLKQVVDWAQSVEQKFAIVEENFKLVAASMDKLTPLIQLSQQLQQRQAQAPVTPVAAQPATGGFEMPPWLAPVLQQIASGGGGAGDNEFIELAKESMRADIGFTKALKSAVISKITGEATTDIAKAASGA